MSHIADYVDWRSDIPLRVAPFNEVDALLLTQLAMIDLEGIVPSPESRQFVTLGEAADLFFKDKKRSRAPLGLIIPREIISLFGKMGKSARFSSMSLGIYVNNTDTVAEQQFSALRVSSGE